MGNFYMVGSCWRAICGFDIENICFAFVDEKSGQLQVCFGLDILLGLSEATVNRSSSEDQSGWFGDVGTPHKL